MKTHHSLILAAGLAALMPTASAQQPPAPPATSEKEPRTEAASAQTAQTAPQFSETEPGLRLNFRGVPLDMVLNYLSDAAGFIIVLDTEVRGKVDVWSNQPLTKQEAVDLLNTVLAKNGYAAIRNGRTLKIVSREDARTKDLPVRSGNDPENIPKSEEMVTQVIPVRRANATQLIQNLQPLLPAYARDSFSANESGNALVLTATQSDVRRMVEIVKALDDSISGTSSIRVFALKYADAKELATAVKDLFQPPTQQNQGGRFFNNPFFGGRGGGNFGGGNNNNGAPGGGRNASTAVNVRVTAVPDEHSNSLIVSGPEDVMPTIENLVREVDVPVSDVTELRVFHLNNANPAEMADIFAELFPDDTRTGNNNQNDFRFGGGGFRGLLNNRLNQTATSERKTKKGRVMAVPDERTSSIIVSAASELMPQIAEMVAQLDASPARKQKVFVYSLENADVQQVEQILRDMFDRSNLQGNRNGANQNSALSNRQLNQQRTGQNSGLGVGGLGNGVGGQGGGAGRTFR